MTAARSDRLERAVAELTYLALNILRGQRLLPATGYAQLVRATVYTVAPSRRLPLLTRSALYRQILTIASASNHRMEESTFLHSGCRRSGTCGKPHGFQRTTTCDTGGAIDEGRFKCFARQSANVTMEKERGQAQSEAGVRQPNPQERPVEVQAGEIPQDGHQGDLLRHQQRELGGDRPARKTTHAHSDR
jgi:hypothetical protein